MNLNEIVFDIEVTPNWWCIVYSDIKDKDNRIVIRSDMDNYLDMIHQMVDKALLIGFNNKGYDLKVLYGIMKSASPQTIYQLSTSIIENKEHYLNNYYYWNKFIFIDLYDDWRFGSLKEFEANMGMDIEESSVPFDKPDLTEDEKLDMISYCKHDILATISLYEYRRNYINAKLILAKKFKINPIDGLKKTMAKILEIILDGKGLDLNQPTTYVIPDKIHKYIIDNVPKDIIELFNEIEYETQSEKHAYLYDNHIVYGVGGIHSVIDNNILVNSDDDYIIENVDATSYYPSLAVQFGYVSRNANKPELYPSIIKDRINIKRLMNIEASENGTDTEKFKQLFEEQDALKLAINIAYGVLKNKYNKLYDPYTASSLCYTGQLLLTALANKLYNECSDLKVIQTNTDGIMIKYHKSHKDKVREICEEWVNVTGIGLEDEGIKTFFQRDVNNYIEIKINGKITLKGGWGNQVDYGKTPANLKAPITHKAMLDYYMYGTPVEETINKCDNLLDFCFTTKTGRTYNGTYHFINDTPVKVNKVNRVFATVLSQYGTLKKHKLVDSEYTKIFKLYHDNNEEYIKHMISKTNEYEQLQILKEHNSLYDYFHDMYHELSSSNEEELEQTSKYDKIASIPDNCYISNDKNMLDTIPSHLDKQWYIEHTLDKIKGLKEI